MMGFSFHGDLSATFLLFCFFSSAGCYALSIAPLFRVVVAEIFPTRVRAKAIGISVFALWSASFLVKLCFSVDTGIS